MKKICSSRYCKASYITLPRFSAASHSYKFTVKRTVLVRQASYSELVSLCIRWTLVHMPPNSLTDNVCRKGPRWEIPTKATRDNANKGEIRNDQDQNNKNSKYIRGMQYVQPLLADQKTYFTVPNKWHVVCVATDTALLADQKTSSTVPHMQPAICGVILLHY